MAYKSITLKNGDTVTLSTSVLRGAGPEGPKGPAGPPGTSSTMRGSVASYADLPVNPQQGDAWHVRDTGRLWAWDTTVAEPLWVDVGRIVGPAAVESIGAQRVRSSSMSLLANTPTICFYTSTTYNDPDPLNTGNTDPAVGGVLHSSTGDDTTVVFPVDPTYYLVTTDIDVQSSVFNPEIEIYWQDTVTTSIVGTSTVRASENGGVYRHVAVISASRAEAWRLMLKSRDDASVESVTTKWTRIGGGSGPIGPVGPAPTMVVGTVSRLPAGTSPTFQLTETTPGTYRVDVGLEQGVQGIAGSGYDTMNALISSGDGVADPSDGTSRTVTDQAITVPDGVSSPALPWYFEQLAESIYNKLVSRLSTADLSARGTTGIAGQMVFNTDTGVLYVGKNHDVGDEWQIVPTVEYGTDEAVVEGAATDRADGSIYFKFG
jgi:hypothetical protein